MSDRPVPGAGATAAEGASPARPRQGAAARADPSVGLAIGAEVKTLVNQVTKLASIIGEASSARQLAAEVTAIDTTVRIVVVGEAKQGKSTLINALVGVDDLSPVDADIATAAPLRVAYGAEPRATLNLDTGDRLSIELDELPRWVSMADAPIAQLRQVSSVDIEVPSALLSGNVVLIDTPGVGGLVAGHAKITLRALKDVHAMLFVTDADTKLTKPELDFLAEASKTIAAVIFVITKTDATPQWAEIVAENRDVLRQHAPRYADAPMVPVSARLASRSRRAVADDKVLAANLWSESGIGKLQSWITTKIRPSAGALTLLNSAVLARATLDGIGSRTELRMRARTDDPEVTAAIETEQARVEELRLDQASWGNQLERELFKARNALKARVKVTAEELQASTAELIAGAARRSDDLVIARIDADLDAQAAALTDEVNAEVKRICDETLAKLNINGVLELESASSGAWHVKPYTPGGTTAANALAAGMTGVTGYGLVSRLGIGSAGDAAAAAVAGGGGAAAGMGSVLSVALPFVVPVIAGLGVAYVIHRVRGGVQHRQELNVWARTEIAKAAGEHQLEIDQALTGAKLDIIDVVRAGLNERTREVTAALEAAKATKAQSDKERAAARTEDQKILNTVAKLRGDADGLIATALRGAKLTAPNPDGFSGPAR